MELQDLYKPAQTETLSLLDQLGKNLPYFVSALIVLVVFYWLARLVSNRINHWVFRRKTNELISLAFGKAVFIFIFLLGIYISLNTLGLTSLAITLAGGTGLIGIGLGFALKGTFENYISGLVISFRDIFRKGELVAVGDFEGIVQNVTTRGTTLMDYDGNSIILPNAQVVASAIKNYSRNPKMRLHFNVGVGYADDLQHVKNLVMDFLKAHPSKVLADPEPMITVTELGSATVNVRIHFWVDTNQVSQFKVRSWAIHSIKNLLMENQVSLPDDAREIIFASPLQIQQQPTPKQDHPKTAMGKYKKLEFLSEETTGKNELEDLRQQAFTTELPEDGSSII